MRQSRSQTETECEGYCDDMFHPEAMVTVTVGDDYYREQWCRTCAGSQFDITEPSRIDSARYYVTAKTVSAFLLGVTVTMLFVLIV